MRNKGSYRKNVLFRWLLGIMIVMIIFSGLLNLYFMGFAAITTAGREMADTLCLEEIIAINDNLDGEKLKEAWAGKEKKDEIIQLDKQLSDFLEKYTYKDKQGRIKSVMNAVFILIPDENGDLRYGGGAWLYPEEVKEYMSAADNLLPADVEDMMECGENETVTVRFADSKKRWPEDRFVCRRLFSRNMKNVWFCVVPNREMLFVSESLDGLEQTIISTIGRAMIFYLLLTVLVYILLHNRLVNPIRKLQNSVFGYQEKTKKENDPANWTFDKPAKMHRDEIGFLADSIEGMTVDLSETMTALLHEKKEMENKEAELNLAAEIQRNAMPTKFPAFPDRSQFDIYAFMRPAKEVGGDFYEFHLMDEDHLGMAIADVSDKGMPAALFMMMSMMALHNYAESGFSPSEIMKKTNEVLLEHNKEGMFVTVWVGILTISTGEVIFANAGHKDPVIRKADGTTVFIKEKHGFMLGVRKNREYKDFVYQMEKGDTLFVFTDGITEAVNTEDELYGEDRLLEAVSGAPPGAAPELLIKHVTAVVDTFAKGAKQSDDMTMLALEYKGV